MVNAQEWLDKNYPQNGTCQEVNSLFGKKRIEVTELNISYQDLSGHLDLSDFVNLKLLNCSHNHLTSLDISKNTKLTELVCDNDLTATIAIIIPTIEQNKVNLKLNDKGGKDKELLDQLIKKYIEYIKFKKQGFGSSDYRKRLKGYEKSYKEFEEKLEEKLEEKTMNGVQCILTEYEEIVTRELEIKENSQQQARVINFPKTEGLMITSVGISGRKYELFCKNEQQVQQIQIPPK